MKLHKEQRKPRVLSAAFQEEHSLVYELCREHKFNQVVEFGTLFGGLTCSALDGMKDFGVLDAFDNFIYADWMNHFGLPLKAGDLFRNIYDNAIKNYSNVVTHKHDFHNEFLWNHPIDLLIVDGLKDVISSQVTVPAFYPFLKVGSYIFDQDLGYKPLMSYWMSQLYYGIRDFIEIVELPWQGTGVLFKVKRALPKELLEIICRFDGNTEIAIQYFEEFNVFNSARTTWIGYN